MCKWENGGRRVEGEEEETKESRRINLIAIIIQPLNSLRGVEREASRRRRYVALRGREQKEEEE